VVNDPLYNHVVFGPEKGKGGNIGKSDDDLIRDLINIHNAENWLGMDGDSDLMMSPALALPLPSTESSDSQGIDFANIQSTCVYTKRASLTLNIQILMEHKLNYPPTSFVVSNNK